MNLKIVQHIIHVDRMVIVTIIGKVNGHVTVNFGGKENCAMNVS